MNLKVLAYAITCLPVVVVKGVNAGPHVIGPTVRRVKSEAVYRRSARRCDHTPARASLKDLKGIRSGEGRDMSHVTHMVIHRSPPSGQRSGGHVIGGSGDRVIG